MSSIAIEFSKVIKRFPGQEPPAVDQISFTIPAGETLALVGPSGCGKTTTLKMINRLIEPTGGDIFVDDRRIHEMPILELRRSLGYVIQSNGLFPHMTVAQNIAVVPELLGWSKERINERIDELLTLVGLSTAEFCGRRPGQLSGGQQQRVGVARALAADPPILLMDEPFGALDPITRASLQSEVADIQRVLKKTFVFVTHDIDEAVKLGDRIAVMRDGKIAQLGTPQELLSSPANDFVADLLGRDRLLKLLQTVRVDRVMMPGKGEADGLGVVCRNATMQDALLEFLRNDVDSVDVVEDGTVVGHLKRQSIFDCATVRT